MRNLLIAVGFLLALASASGQQSFWAMNHEVASGNTVSQVHYWANNYSCQTDTSPCYFTISNNPTAGNLLLFDTELDESSATVTVTSTGSGCPASWSSVGSVGPVGSSHLTLTVYKGVAAGSGSCELEISVSGGTGTSAVGITGAELTGQSASPIDATASGSITSGSSLSLTAGNATTSANDYALTFWSSNLASNSIAVSGWSELAQNVYESETYGGNFGIAVPTAGTTVGASISNLNSTGGAGVAFMVVVK